MLIQILVDNPNSWIIPYAKELQAKLIALGYDPRLFHNHDQVIQGDILCLLSCEKLFKDLNLNKHNLVIHESDLPKGRGWSPLTWQVLEGENEIPITLFEAAEDVDAGVIYSQEIVTFNGDELIDELRAAQGNSSIRQIISFVLNYPKNKGREQTGIPQYYRKRSEKDSQLDVDKTIKEQFNLLRVVDNERYPAFIEIMGCKYYIKISKQK